MSSRSQDLIVALVRRQREILAALIALSATIDEEIEEQPNSDRPARVRLKVSRSVGETVSAGTDADEDLSE
jgi:hypothetical protein